MNEDPRCCGSGTCIIDTEGRCWCGQRWDGQKMCHAPLLQPQPQPQPEDRAPAELTRPPGPSTESTSCPEA
jgi:hypothetical protein